MPLYNQSKSVVFSFFYTKRQMSRGPRSGQTVRPKQTEVPESAFRGGLITLMWKPVHSNVPTLSSNLKSLRAFVTGQKNECLPAAVSCLQTE